MNTHALLTSKAARRWLAIALCAGAANVGAQPYYSFSPLPSNAISFDPITIDRTAINSAGHVVATVRPGVDYVRGMLWTAPSTAVRLPSTSGSTLADTYAYDINNAGWIAGKDIWGAAIWINNQPTRLRDLAHPVLGGAAQSEADALNDAGQVVGYTTFARQGEHADRATLWDNGHVTDLGTLGGTSGYANDINNASMVVGSSQLTQFGPLLATLWHNGTITNLGGTGNLVSVATAINDAGKVVGYSDDRAAMWEGGSLTYLSSLASQATDINNRGQVVGWTTPDVWGNREAMLWNGTTATNLNSFLSQSDRDAGWRLEDAGAINDLGWIAGSAFNSQTGDHSAYLLAVAPIPEAATLTLWLAGLGVLAIASRRMRVRRFA